MHDKRQQPLEWALDQAGQLRFALANPQCDPRPYHAVASVLNI